MMAKHSFVLLRTGLRMMIGSAFSIGLIGCGAPEAPKACLSEFSFGTEKSSVALGQPELGGNQLAQSFQVTLAGTVPSVSLSLKKQGTLGDSETLSVKIYDALPPAGKVLSEASLLVSTLPAEIETYIPFTFSKLATLELAKTYFLILQGSFPLSRTNTVLWGTHEGQVGGYDIGEAFYQTESGGWSNAKIGAQRDFLFRVGC